ncbi:MAG: OmpA family protein [Myxococcales bacterium]|nr:OmpA family protein [Myxococcales bacterium]
MKKTFCAARVAIGLVAMLAISSDVVAEGKAATPTSPPPAIDKKIDLGLFFGARIFSDDAALGAFDPAVPPLAPTAVISPRVTWRIMRSLWIEGELPIAPTTTKERDVKVFWFAPRALATWNTGGKGVRGLVSLGVDMPTSLSAARGIFGSEVSVSGVAGLGVAWSRDRLTFRLDARHLLTLAREPDAVTSEWEFVVGFSYRLVKKTTAPPPAPIAADTDGDGVVDADDQCPRGKEDQDAHEDGDGCPDIDDDGDGVLDDIDKCKSIAENLNGFEDEDGCPDVLPSEFELVMGPIEGISFTRGSDEVTVKSRRLDAIAAIMAKYPSARIRLVGYVSAEEVSRTDDEPDVAAAEKLGRARAEAVRAELQVRGVAGTRMRLDSKGGEQAAGDEPATPRQVALQMDDQ